MPLIRYRNLSAGPMGVRAAGSVHEVTEAEANDLVRGGHGELVPEIVEPASSHVAETADAAPAGETAAMKPNGSRKKR